MTDIDRKLVEILDFWVNDVDKNKSKIKVKEMRDTVFATIDPAQTPCVKIEFVYKKADTFSH